MGSGRPDGAPTPPTRFLLSIAAFVLAALTAPTFAGANDADDGLIGALDRLRVQDARVATIAFRLETANSALCPEKAPLAGWVLHHASQYAPRLRTQAMEHFHLGQAPAVLAIAPGGPAAAAGLQPDDSLIAIDGEILAADGEGEATPNRIGPATYRDMAWDLSTIDRILRRGAAQLTIERRGQRKPVTMQPDTGCAYDVEVVASAQIDASADGQHIFVTSALAEFAPDDSDLASVIAHEMAHNILRHKARLDQKGFARRWLGALGSASADLMASEREADYLGPYLAARAGYDVRGAPVFWARLTRDRGKPFAFRRTHPPATERIHALESTVEEIEERRRDGKALEPDAARLSLF